MLGQEGMKKRTFNTYLDSPIYCCTQSKVTRVRVSFELDGPFRHVPILIPRPKGEIERVDLYN